MRPRAARVFVPVLALVCGVAVAGCSKRKPITRRDAGPAVEVVDAQKRPSDLVRGPIVDEKEPDDDVAHAQPLAAGSVLRGFLAAPRNGKGDADVFSFLDATAPRDLGGFDYLRVELSGVPGLDLALEVLDGDGKRLLGVNDGGPGEPEVVTNAAAEPGHTYYVRVKEVGVAKGDPDHPYELFVASLPALAGDEREPNDDARHATTIERSGSEGHAGGFFGKKRDEDWLEVAADAIGERGLLRLELAPPEGVAPALRVPGAGKELLAEARGQKNQELRLRNVSVAAGKIVIVLRAADGHATDKDARWSLRFSLEHELDGAEREPNNDVRHATPLPLESGEVSGFLWPGDVDVFHVTGAAPDAVVALELDGVPDVKLKLERLGADGKSVARAEGGVGAAVRLPPAPLGDGYVRVSARARDTAFDQPYRLSAKLAPHP